VTAQEPPSENGIFPKVTSEVMHGFEASRESAHIEGDTALFNAALRKPTMTTEIPLRPVAVGSARRGSGTLSTMQARYAMKIKGE
jgi:hypothetical protein